MKPKINIIMKYISIYVRRNSFVNEMKSIYLLLANKIIIKRSKIRKENLLKKTIYASSL